VYCDDFVYNRIVSVPHVFLTNTRLPIVKDFFSFHLLYLESF